MTPDGNYIAGVSEDTHGKSHAYRWNNGAMIDLIGLDMNAVSAGALPFDMTDDGKKIVGVAYNDSIQYPWLWVEGEGAKTFETMLQEAGVD